MGQTGKNIVVALKVEETFNTAPGDTDAEQLRINASPGLSLKRALIESGEMRSDLLTTIARLGSQEVPGSYTSEFSVGSFDTILQAVMRSTWVAAVAITEADMTSITTTTSTIVAAAGSWITEGVRVGDVVRLTDHATAANNNLNLRVTAVTASTITVAGTPLTLDASADSAFTLTILKKLINGATPTRRSFYIEEYLKDLDLSVVHGGCRAISLQFNGQPDGHVMLGIGVLGASAEPLADSASPYYTTPTQYTSVGLVMADASIRFGGEEVTAIDNFQLNITISASAMSVCGSSTTPDVFDTEMKVTGAISGLRRNLTNLTRYKDETELELHVLLVEPETAPADCVSIFVPRLKLTDVDSALGGDGPMVENLPFTVGVKTAATGYDQTMLSICTSAA